MIKNAITEVEIGTEDLNFGEGHGLVWIFFLDHTQRRTTIGRTPLDK